MAQIEEDECNHLLLMLCESSFLAGVFLSSQYSNQSTGKKYFANNIVFWGCKYN